MVRGDNMLTKFSVTNFRNFKDKIILDFTQKHDYQYNLECIKNDILSKLIIFGKNGVGKSNFGYALFDIVMTTTDLFVTPSAYNSNIFLNADSDIPYAEFNYEFQFNEDIIKYNYRKSEPKTIVYEQLIVNDVEVYEFDYIKKQGKFDNLNLIGAETLALDIENIDFSIFKFIANNTIQKEGSIINSLSIFIKNMLWFRSLQGNNFIGIKNTVEDIEEWIVNNNLIKEFEEFLNEMSEVKTDLINNKVGNSNILIDRHKKRKLIFNNIASSGTNSLQLFFYWSKKFEETSFLYIDEFDAFYHFELSEKIIRFILKYENMQAILTSHNTNLADNNLMRPDCYFMLKSGKLKSFVKSTNRELREGHNLGKMLKEGEFDG